MANVRRTAMGGAVDMDMLRLANETTIAIGNARTNARGDELGHGGKVVKTRAQIVQEYHQLNTPMAHDIPTDEDFMESTYEPQVEVQNLSTPVASDGPVNDAPTTPSYVKPRGSFAESVAKETEVNQELLEPANKKPAGVSRI